MFKITGLDKLQKELDEAQRALSELDGELGRVSFDPQDPASIEVAIQEIHRVVDERAGGFASNPFVAPLIGQMKETFRENVLKRAAEARLKANKD